ncbi:F0F1 ATP synthase subunit epsilon [Leeuwenhoekiella marinoflava]|uniref:F-type H+-transporting ATPase subunit epsilon n=2 Tax=Leeuwenhoekiella marinoflava TaxID=988 RepID=A0A4Q0PRE4_9FLAO|nr:F0F1 ATP synthase subunit epsilon [Leeuwenhoekiella marinoflava]RXG33181.1 F-type H+-transporting ATPase subunit epsilon [Leeuwenhoekiella marinoflava]SHE41511.1 F-type H+-transporting ATPase subunit epsilon [Leeuwenhoekiella marinoflava DSM 3653]
MHLEIVSPEATLYSGEATSVIVPGTDGAFQLLDNHAPIVSILMEGIVKVKGATLSDKAKKHFTAGKDAGEITLAIKSGTVEMKDNKVIVLVD